MAKQTIVVFGATGKQGGSVVQSLLSDSKTASAYHIKAVTRDTTKDTAKALSALGAELVQADLDDVASLHAVLKGAYGAFAVTNFWEKMNAAAEEAQGKAVADVCKAEGVQHLVFSSLLNVKELSGGVLPNVFHFDSKANVEAYIREIGQPASFFLPGFFMANIPGAGLRQLPPNNQWGLAFPLPADAPMPLLAAGEDTGKFVKGMFLNREKVLGKRVYGATDYYTPEQIISQWRELYPVDGKDAKFNRLPDAVFKGIIAQRGAPEVVQEEMLQNMRLMPEFGYYGGDSLEFSHSILDEPLTTWKEFAKASPVFSKLK